MHNVFDVDWAPPSELRTRLRAGTHHEFTWALKKILRNTNLERWSDLFELVRTKHPDKAYLIPQWVQLLDGPMWFLHVRGKIDVLSVYFVVYEVKVRLGFSYNWTTDRRRGNVTDQDRVWRNCPGTLRVMRTTDETARKNTIVERVSVQADREVISVLCLEYISSGSTDPEAWLTAWLGEKPLERRQLFSECIELSLQPAAGAGDQELLDRITELERAKGDLEEELRIVRKQLGAVESTSNALEAGLLGLIGKEAESAAATQVKDTSPKAVDTLERQLETMRSNAEAFVDQLERSTRESAGYLMERNRLSQELSAERKRIGGLEQELAQAVAAGEELREELERARSGDKTNELQASVTDLERRLFALETAKREAEERASASQDRYLRSNTALEEARATLRDLELELAERDKIDLVDSVVAVLADTKSMSLSALHKALGGRVDKDVLRDLLLELEEDGITTRRTERSRWQLG